MRSLAVTTRICAVVLILWVCVSPSSAKAQSWNPIGDTWWYDNNFNDATFMWFYTLTCVGDTVLDSKPSFRFEGYSNLQDQLIPEPIKDTVFFMHENQDKYYLWDAIHEEFFMLYDFNAQSGDTFMVQHDTYRGYGVLDSLFPSPLKFFVIVDSIGTIQRNGETFKAIYTHSPIGGYFFGPYIAEGIGPLDFGFFFGAFEDFSLGNWTKGFRCYKRADGFLVENIYPPAIPHCGYAVGMDLPLQPKHNLNLHPNPASSLVSAILPDFVSRQVGMAYLYDHTGRLMVQLALSPGQDNLMIDVSTFPSGIYFINLESTDGSRLAGKIMKQ